MLGRHRRQLNHVCWVTDTLQDTAQRFPASAYFRWRPKEAQIRDEQENVTTWLKPCVHYDRGCQLKCDECDEFYSCRFCHNIENDSINLVTPALTSYATTPQNAATSIIKYNGLM